MNFNNHHDHQQPFEFIVTAGLVHILEYGVSAGPEVPGCGKENLEFWKPWALLFDGEVFSCGSEFDGN